MTMVKPLLTTLCDCVQCCGELCVWCCVGVVFRVEGAERSDSTAQSQRGGLTLCNVVQCAWCGVVQCGAGWL